MPGLQQLPKVVVVGATGNVGRKFVDLLLQRNIVAANQLELLASHKSAGKLFVSGTHQFTIKNAEEFDYHTTAIYLFATESDISKHFIEKITADDAVIIDSSSLSRMLPNVPLIVAPVNQHLMQLSKHKRYALANCVASPASLALAPLHATYQIKTLHITTYQSVSGAGKDAMDELQIETSHVTENKPYQRQHFQRQIAFNVIPQIGSILENGFTQEENKIMQEIQKILGSHFPVSATSVRVPVFIGHSSLLTVEFVKPCTPEQARALLAKTAGLKVYGSDYATPVEIAGTDEVHVGRIRKDPAASNTLHLWLCSDNLRRGAALDAAEAVEIALSQLQKG